MKQLLLIAIILTVSALATELSADEVPASDIVIVANLEKPPATISTSDIEALYDGKSTKIGEEKITITILKDGDVHISFLKNFLKKTPGQFLSSWKKQVFSGKAKMPKDFDTEADMVAYITKTPGTIGYIHVKTSQDTSIVTDKVKTIPIK